MKLRNSRGNLIGNIDIAGKTVKKYSVPARADDANRTKETRKRAPEGQRTRGRGTFTKVSMN